MIKVKSATTYREQIEILRKRNVQVSDYDACERFLHNVNYYRFSAYLLSFRQKESDRYRTVSFERIVRIYTFDQNVRKCIYGVIDDIENRIKTQLAYYHGHKYGPMGYMDEKNYNNAHNHERFLEMIDNCIHENRKSLIVKHHVEKYNGKFPIWTIIDFFSIGNLSYFYRGMRGADREKIAKELFGVKFKEMDSWMRCLTDLRNRCAHYARLYYWIFPAIPKMPKVESFEPNRRLFSQIFMLKMMYDDSEKWNTGFLRELEEAVEKYQDDILLKNVGFPENWMQLLQK